VAFRGTRSFAEALDLARKGWPEGAEAARRFAGQFGAVAASNVLRPEIGYAVCGDTIDMGRYLMGEPECFMEWRESEVSAAGAKVLKVAINISISSAIPADAIMRRGAAMIALVDLLEQAGRRCEVWVASATCSNGEHYREFAVRLKEAGQPLETDRLAFAMCHPSMERRLERGLSETVIPVKMRDAYDFTSGGAGKPCPLRHTAGDVVMPEARYRDANGAIDPTWLTDESCIAKVLALLEAQGIAMKAA
jgi:hypothetical protein